MGELSGFHLDTPLPARYTLCVYSVSYRDGRAYDDARGRGQLNGAQQEKADEMLAKAAQDERMARLRLRELAEPEPEPEPEQQPEPVSCRPVPVQLRGLGISCLQRTEISPHACV
jgi:hypothetical protein